MNILQKLLILTLLQSILFAQTLKLQTVEESNPAKGVLYKKFIDPQKPLSINLLEIDLTNPNLDLMAATAFDSVAGNQQVSRMFAEKNKQSQNIIAAINADFYEKGGFSTNTLIVDGYFVSMPNKHFFTIGFDKTNRPSINIIDLEANLYHKGQTIKLNGINKTRATDELLLYNKFMGKGTHTNQWGAEVALKPLTGISVNDTLSFVVIKKQSHKGNMPINRNNFVLSGHSSGANFINKNLTVGDTIQIFIGLKNMPKMLDDLVGGFSRLVKNGINIALASYDKLGHKRDYFALSRHPRTAIGFNKQKSKLYMVTVDGRQAKSIGLTLPGLADLMIQFGAYEALNLDGGGSTTMVVKGKVVNSPSDLNGERAVSNALMVRLK
jgi:phosphodiester glycosidase